MDWTASITKNAGDLLTADDWNTYIRDDTPWFDWKSTSKTVNTSTAETDLFNGEIILPSSVMGSSERLQGWASYDIKNNTGAATNTPRFKLKLDSTVLFDTNTTGGTPIAASATRGAGMVMFTLQELDATNAQEVTIEGYLVDGGKVTFTTGSGVYATNGSNDGQRYFGRSAVAVDMTSARTVSFTVINPSANANWETKLYAAKVVVGT